MNPLTLSIIGLYKTAVIRRRGSWSPHAGHGVDGRTQSVPHARAVVTDGIVGPTQCLRSLGASFVTASAALSARCRLSARTSSPWCPVRVARLVIANNRAWLVDD